MSKSIRNRLLIIAGMIALAVFYLFPRTITIRERGPDGAMSDVQIRRIPLKLGLDLQGGMHLGLELDQSVKVSADPANDLQLALTVIRKRTNEFGVAEPLVQQQGAHRIVVELAGISDPARAKAIVQKAAFLEFKITDKTGSLERAIPAMDRALQQMARELLLAQSSDWAFLMKTGTASEYATRRTKEHILRFTRLYEMLMEDKKDESFLNACEGRDNLFPDIQWRHYL